MILIYDGDCGFCTNCASFGQARLRRPVEIYPWQSISDLSQYGLTQQDVLERVYFVNHNGTVVGGARALCRFGQHMKFGWEILGTILLVPPLIYIAEFIYRIVARNRHRLPGSSGACRIDTHTEAVSGAAKKSFFGLLVYLRSHIREKLELDREEFSHHKLSYPEVGATQGTYPDDYPAGYNVDFYDLIIGQGKQDFATAVEGFTSWESHKRSGLIVSSDDIAFIENTTVVLGMGFGPFVLGFPDRIIYVEHGPQYFQCAYGTVQGHPEKGEELFRIELNEDGDVLMTIICFSKIVAPLARIGFPVARYLQKRISRQYLTSLREYVSENQ